MEGLAAAIALMVIVAGVLLAQRLPKRSPQSARKPRRRWIGAGWVVLFLAVIGLWVGIESASTPQPPPAVQLTCPAGPIWGPWQGLCQQF
jgi:disulfide bond formation protein DsbB